MSAPMAAITDENHALWERAQELQGPTRLLHKFETSLPGLASLIQQNLGSIKIAGVSIEWDCETFLAGSVKNDTATSGADLDVLVIFKPRLTVYSVSVDLVSSTCSFLLTPKSSSTSKSTRIAIGNDSLSKIWQAFVKSVKEFTDQHHSILNIPEIRPREWAKLEDDPAGQMKASFSLEATEVDVLPAFKTAANVFLVLLRSCKPDGSNIVKSFSHLGARLIASLPDKAKHLICALKHVVKVVHGFEVPGSMFESVVLEVFEQQGWIGDLDEVQSALISFIEAWRLCWHRILSWRPISAPDKSLEEDVDLLSGIDKTELTRVGEALSSIDEKSLLDECLNGTRESLARLIHCRSQSSTSSSSSSSSFSSSSSAAISSVGMPSIQLVPTTGVVSDSAQQLAVVTSPSNIDMPALVEISLQLKLNQDIAAVQKAILLEPSYIGDSALVGVLVSHDEPYRSSVLPWNNVLSPALPSGLFAALRIEHLCVRDLLLSQFPATNFPIQHHFGEELVDLTPLKKDISLFFRKSEQFDPSRKVQTASTPIPDLPQPYAALNAGCCSRSYFTGSSCSPRMSQRLQNDSFRVHQEIR